MKLKELCGGVVYISETDSPLTPIVEPSGGNSSLEKFVLDQLLLGDKKPITSEPAENFFRRLTADREWYGLKERGRAKNFAALREMIYNNVDDVRMIRAGRINIDIFVLGFDAAGNVAGFRTRAVET